MGNSGACCKMRKAGRGLENHIPDTQCVSVGEWVPSEGTRSSSYGGYGEDSHSCVLSMKEEHG